MWSSTSAIRSSPVLNSLQPRLWLVRYGEWTGFASATLIGVNRSARSTVAELVEMLDTELTSTTPRMHGQGSRAHVLEPFKEHVVQRWNEGCRNARQIWREIQAQGYEHSSRLVAWFMAELRKETGSGRGWATVEAAAVYDVESKRKRPLTARQAAHLVVMRAEKRSAWEETYHRHLCVADPEIAQVVALASDFAEMVRQRQGARLDPWLLQTETSKIAELCSFAASLRKDYRAVKAGLSLPYSNGQTEGQITRLKLLKRMSYGRAGLELLRHRVLHREPPFPVHSRRSKGGAQLAA